MSLNRLYFLITLLLILTMSKSLSAQSEMNSKASIIDKNLLLEDLKILKNNLEMAQPGLYNYTSKKDLDFFFEQVKYSITDDMSSIDFFRLIAPLSDLIKNGHSILVPSSQWEDYVITSAKLLPLDLYFYKDQIYILHNLSDKSEIAEGATLKSINGKSAIELFNYMVERWFKDGYNQTRPREIVEEEFRLLYTHFFGASEKYKLEIENSNGEPIIVEVDGIQESEFKKRLKENFGKEFIPWWRREAEPLSFETINGTGYLKVTQFNNGLQSTDGDRFNKFIKNAFKTIKKKEIVDLVLDLRGNQGGDVKPQLELLRHLIKKPFHLYSEVFANLRRLPNPELYEFDALSKAEFKNNFSSIQVAGVHPMKSRPGFEAKPQSPSENLFKGNLYVLIDGWSFSASGEVSGLIKEHLKDAVFIGEETGGNPVTNISGIQTFLTLPNSKNRILICLVNYTAAVTYKNEGHGIIPSHWVRNTVRQEIKNEDAILDKALEIIEENKR